MAQQSNTDFNVDIGTGQAYLRFIEGLRRLFGRRSSHDLPVCVEQFQQPIQWQNITLRSNTHSIILRIRMDNLYLVGYQIVHQQQWFELDNDQHAVLIPGSTPLGFSGDYYSLQTAGGIEVMENVRLGQQQLVAAVNGLATSTGNEQNDVRTRAKKLIVVIQMICESMRFNPISNYLTGQYNLNPTITTWMLTLERSWGTLSALLLRADAYPNEPFSLRNPIHIPGGPDDVNEITTIQNVIKVLGILLGLCFRPNRLPRSVPEFVALVKDSEISSDHEQCLLGRPLLEVFSVVVNNIDNENPGQLYGTILVTHGLDFEYIFDRSSHVPETIYPGESIFLNGPFKSLLAYDSFTIQAALFDYDRWSHDDEVSKDQITWNTYDTTKPYNVPLSTELKGHYGKVNVNYVVLTDAVAARISITLKDGDGESTAQVYGDINTRIGDWNGENQKTVLFHLPKNDYENVREGYTIPLRRSVVAVPTNSSLRVIAKLYDHDVLSWDDEIANNTAVFPAKLSGSSEQLIDGKHGHIKVTVTWNFDI